jgi:hypothetical protein
MVKSGSSVVLSLQPPTHCARNKKIRNVLKNTFYTTTGCSSQSRLSLDLAGDISGDLPNHGWSTHYDIKAPYTGLCKI